MTPEQRIVKLERVLEGLEKGIKTIYRDVRYAYNIANHCVDLRDAGDQSFDPNLHMLQENLAIAIINLQDIHKHCQLKDSNVTTLEIPPLAIVPIQKPKP